MDSGLGARIQKVSDVRRYFENRAIAAEHPNGDRIVIVPVGDVFAARQLTKKIAGSPGMTVNLTEDRKTVVLITPNAENATRDAAELCAPSADVTEVEGVTLELAPGSRYAVPIRSSAAGRS